MAKNVERPGSGMVAATGVGFHYVFSLRYDMAFRFIRFAELIDFSNAVRFIIFHRLIDF